MLRMRKTSSEPLLVPELAGESERLWLVESAPVALPDGAEDLRGHLAWDGGALGGTVRRSGGDCIVGLYRQVVTCSTYGPMWATVGVAGV
jgi:hypothetical protein